MKNCIALLLTFSSSCLIAQNSRVFYDQFERKTDSLKAAYTAHFSGNDEERKFELQTFPGGKTVCTGAYKTITVKRHDSLGGPYQKEVKHGNFKRYYPSGELKSSIDYENGKVDGFLVTHYQNGIRRRNEMHEKGILMRGHCYTSLGKDTTRFSYWVDAKFPGGQDSLIQYVNSKKEVPATVKAKFYANQEQYKKAIGKKEWKRKAEAGQLANFTEKVTVTFVVLPSGKVSEIEAEHENVDLKEEAENIVGLIPNWQPARQDGYPTFSIHQVEILFEIQNEWNVLAAE